MTARYDKSTVSAWSSGTGESLSLSLSLSLSPYSYPLLQLTLFRMVKDVHVPFYFNPLGAAGVAGALIYAGLTFVISPKATLLIQLFMPLVMLVTYLCILGKPMKILPTEKNGENGHIQDPSVPIVTGDIPVTDAPPSYSKVEQQDASDGTPLLGGAAKKTRLRFFNKEEAGKT